MVLTSCNPLTYIGESVWEDDDGLPCWTFDLRQSTGTKKKKPQPVKKIKSKNKKKFESENGN
jgi:DNA/RNA-binding domain of Phe-tRNA-synthetase-like protein